MNRDQNVHMNGDASLQK